MKLDSTEWEEPRKGEASRDTWCHQCTIHFDWSTELGGDAVRYGALKVSCACSLMSTEVSGWRIHVGTGEPLAGFEQGGASLS